MGTINENRIKKALGVIHSYGGIDGDHHKSWVLDQVLRELLGHDYPAWVVAYEKGEDGPKTYEWDKGIAP